MKIPHQDDNQPKISINNNRTNENKLDRSHTIA